ncbi:hypothetical protein D9M70_604690 [compost metagenome]
MVGVRIEPPGIFGIGQVVQSVEQVGPFAAHQDNRMLRPQAHNLIRRQQLAAGELLAGASALAPVHRAAAAR